MAQRNENLTKKGIGFGIGLRPDHYAEIDANPPDIDWLEIISEDFLVEGGRPLYYLDRIREHFPMAMHGVSMSIGGSDPLDMNYLKRLRNLMHRVEPLWVSDHLCWTGVDDINLHDLMPMPYIEEAIDHVVERVKRVQDFLGQRILLENVSCYLNYNASTMPEWEFISTIAERADCLILLDVNNIYVNAFNHGFNAQDYLNGIPIDRVQQFHLAGHKNYSRYIIDTHDENIIPQVWELYKSAVDRFGDVATLIERDDNIPPLSELIRECHRAKELAVQQYVA